MFYQGLESFTVCFFGHRYIDKFAFAEIKVEALLSSLFTNGKYLELLVGRDGDFDQIVSSSICRAKKRYGDTNCSHVWVAPYSTAELSNNQKEFCEYYDEIEVASDRLGKLHPKAAFQARNRMMVDRSDLVVVYIAHESGGAFQTYQYAIKTGKKVINLAEDNDE